MDRNLARGLYLAAIALAFGLPSLRYPQGTLSHAGAGLFPLLMSGTLLVIALMIIGRSRFVERQPLALNLRNIGLILLGLAAFALVSRFVNMIAGIAAMVFIVTLAGRTYSWTRNLKIAAGLIAVAFAFAKLLGLNLPLY